MKARVTLRRQLLLALLLLLLIGARLAAHAQSVGIGTTTPAASAALDVTSTSKGLLPPRLTQAQRDAIASPAVGLTLYNTTANALNVWDGTQWQQYQPSQAGPTATFSTPGTYSYTVPAGVRSLYVLLGGAAGGSGTGTSGGGGGQVQGRLAVVPGQDLIIVVGGGGDLGVAGSNGGGQPTAQTGGGGGASDIRKSTGALTDRLLVAGGGGGGSNGGLGGTGVYQDPNAFGNGGGGGGLTGEAGGNEAYRTSTSSTGYNRIAFGGAGGSTTRGGQGGTGYGGSSGRSGSLGQGGDGSLRGGAGGGGYYGGGGGGTLNSGSPYNIVGGGGGGGGSSFADASATSNVVYTQGSSGSGMVVLTPLTAPLLDGSNILNLPGDNLGNHTATQTLNLNGNSLTNGASLSAVSVLTPTTGGHNMLAAAYGTVGGSATNLSSSGNYTVARTPGASVGSYRLSFTAASGLSATDLTNAPITALLFGNQPGFITYVSGTGYLDVFTYSPGGALTDRGFSFSLFLP